jgi:hypothetical protein
MSFTIVLCIDESPLKFKGKFKYIWVFRGNSIVGYTIGTRSRNMLDRILGDDFAGAIVCDSYAVYPSFQKDH